MASLSLQTKVKPQLVELSFVCWKTFDNKKNNQDSFWLFYLTLK